jgi:hypothetical protein
MTGTPYYFQVAVDAARPHELADWWAATLGWEVEQQDPGFIRQMIAEGHATEADTATHDGRLVWREGAAISPRAGAADGPPWRVYFQLVPEPRTVKNRLHLDVRVGEGNAEEAVAALTARGAIELWRGTQGPHGWVTMADPEGNEFCVT